MISWATDKGISRISFNPASELTPATEQDQTIRAAAAEISAYLNGQKTTLDFPLDRSLLTPFQQRMFASLEKLAPYGEATTYGELAASLDSRGARSIGQALGANPLPLALPCHRVLAKGGKIGGFGGGLQWKEQLLRLEGSFGE